MAIDNGLGLTLGAIGLLVATGLTMDRGSRAVDPRKRREALRRMAAPNSGASASERATAQRQLAKMGEEPTPTRAPRGQRTRSQRTRSQTPPWQTDARGMSDIYTNNFQDLNFTKKAIYEHASKPRIRVTFHAFDGTYGRSVLEAFSSEDDLGFASKAFEAWGDKYHKKDGVFEAVLAVQDGTSHISQIVRIRGTDVSKNGLWIRDSSFNRNPFNDHDFARRLREMIE